MKILKKVEKNLLNDHSYEILNINFENEIANSMTHFNCRSVKMLFLRRFDPLNYFCLYKGKRREKVDDKMRKKFHNVSKLNKIHLTQIEITKIYKTLPNHKT